MKIDDSNVSSEIAGQLIMLTPEKFKSQKEKNSNTIKVNEDSFLDEFLPQVCLTPATVEVVDKSGNIKGYITEKELSVALTKSKSDIDLERQKGITAIDNPNNIPICNTELFDRAINAKYNTKPNPITDDITLKIANTLDIFDIYTSFCLDLICYRFTIHEDLRFVDKSIKII